MKSGRPRLLDDDHKTDLLNWYAAGGRDYRVKASELGVSGATLRRQIKRWQVAVSPRHEDVGCIPEAAP